MSSSEDVIFYFVACVPKVISCLPPIRLVGGAIFTFNLLKCEWLPLARHGAFKDGHLLASLWLVWLHYELYRRQMSNDLSAALVQRRMGGAGLGRRFASADQLGSFAVREGVWLSMLIPLAPS